jgi:hypothetical protein
MFGLSPTDHNIGPVSEYTAICSLFSRSLFISECGFKMMQFTSTIRVTRAWLRTSVQWLKFGGT